MVGEACGLLAEGDMLGCEMQRGLQAQAKILINAPLAQQTDGEAGAEIVVAHPPLLACLGIDIPSVGHNDALLVEAEGESVVERAQVDVGLVLHHAPALLCRRPGGQQAVGAYQ